MYYKLSNAELSFAFSILLDQLNHSYEQGEFVAAMKEQYCSFQSITSTNVQKAHLCCSWFTCVDKAGLPERLPNGKPRNFCHMQTFQFEMY